MIPTKEQAMTIIPFELVNTVGLTELHKFNRNMMVMENGESLFLKYLAVNVKINDPVLAYKILGSMNLIVQVGNKPMLETTAYMAANAWPLKIDPIIKVERKQNFGLNFEIEDEKLLNSINQWVGFKLIQAHLVGTSQREMC